MKKLLTILLFASLTAQAQLNIPKARILCDLDEFTQRQIGDTVVIDFFDATGHIFFIPINRFPQSWYFVDDVSVKVVVKQTVLGHMLDKRHVRRKWIEREGYYQKGNKGVRFENRNYIMWKIN